jgi:hypothetical protein
MRSPYSGDRQAIVNSCLPVNTISLHSYQTATSISAAQGAALLAQAVNDISRTFRPVSFNAVGLFVIESTALALASKLQTVNQVCSLTAFVEAQRIASSMVSLDDHKMQLPVGGEQSIEWQPMHDVRSVTALRTAFNDASKSLLLNEGKALVSNIDTAIGELRALKADRDTRIVQSDFVVASLPIETTLINANSARSLADNIRQLGDNNRHWAFMFFVGSDNDIKLIKELFA